MPYTLSMAWSYPPSNQDGHTPLPNTSWVSWPYPSPENMVIHGSTAAQHSSACHPPATCQSQIPRDHQGTKCKQTDMLRKKCLRGTKSKFTFPLLSFPLCGPDLPPANAVLIPASGSYPNLLKFLIYYRIMEYPELDP